MQNWSSQVALGPFSVRSLGVLSLRPWHGHSRGHSSSRTRAAPSRPAPRRPQSRTWAKARRCSGPRRHLSRSYLAHTYKIWLGQRLKDDGDVPHRPGLVRVQEASSEKLVLRESSCWSTEGLSCTESFLQLLVRAAAAAGLTHTAGAAVWHGLVVASIKSLVHQIKFQMEV